MKIEFGAIVSLYSYSIFVQFIYESYISAASFLSATMASIMSPLAVLVISLSLCAATQARNLVTTDGNVVLLNNHLYNYRIAMPSTNPGDVIVYHGNIYDDQKWVLCELKGEYKGYFVIENYLRKGYKLANVGGGKIITCDGSFNPAQAWKFEHIPKGYNIINFLSNSASLSVWAPGLYDWGLKEGKMSAEQIWNIFDNDWLQ